VGVAEAMADMAMVAVVAAEEAVVAAVDEDMVAAADAKTKIIITIAMSTKSRQVTVHRHLLVEVGTMFLRA